MTSLELAAHSQMVVQVRQSLRLELVQRASRAHTSSLSPCFAQKVQVSGRDTLAPRQRRARRARKRSVARRGREIETERQTEKNRAYSKTRTRVRKSGGLCVWGVVKNF